MQLGSARPTKNLLRVGIASAAILMTSCATPPPPRVVTLEEQIRQDHQLGTQLSEAFEGQFKIKKDIDVSVFLRRVAERLAHAEPKLKESPVGVFVVQDRDSKWRNYGLPGNRVYLSAGFLKSVEYENELAAAMALELAHLLSRHALNRLEKAPGVVQLESGSLIEGILPAQPDRFSASIDYFSPKGIFSFEEGEYLASAEIAVGLLYRAGYDPRGMVSLWNRYLQSPAISPVEKSTLSALLENTRQWIATSAPLRNPVVRSQEFVAIQKRIQKL